MKTLVIDNIGPIKHVELKLKRVNVVIGPQSAGKSCILKIACFCAWAEKRIQLQQDKNGFSDNDYMQEQLIEFHKMTGFFEKGQGSRFKYETPHLWLQYDYDNQENPFTWGWNKNGHWKYKRTRISYIPAERNVVATIPNWMEVSMKNNNIRNFVSDWMLTRSFYNKDNKLDILNLGVRYFFDEQSGQDYIELDNGKLIQFTNGSSGIQSAVPMLVYLGYLFENQYKTGQYGKISTDSENEEILNHIYDNKKFSYGMKAFMKTNTPYIGKIGMGKRFFKSEQAYMECKELFESYTKTWRSDIYLEEPEQNLFPETQLDLIYYLLSMANTKQDGLFIATHSPYVLYALNNCMLGGFLSKKSKSISKVDFIHKNSWIHPKEVSVWELRDGHLSSDIDELSLTLQDEDGLIRGNYFDRIMKLIMTDFSNLSAYL